MLVVWRHVVLQLESSSSLHAVKFTSSWTISLFNNIIRFPINIFGKQNPYLMSFIQCNPVTIERVYRKMRLTIKNRIKFCNWGFLLLSSLSFGVFVYFYFYHLLTFAEMKYPLLWWRKCFCVTSSVCVCVLAHLALGGAQGVHRAAQRLLVSLQCGPLALQGGDDRGLHPVKLGLAPQATQLLLHGQTVRLQHLR